MKSFEENSFPGKLFIVEGIDGSGKSTQLSLLYQWLQNEDYGVFYSKWNSSPIVKSTTKRGKTKQILTPTTFSLVHATDFADRFEREIIPPLKAGAIVLADRYIYTAFARDIARGVNTKWVKDLYQFAVKPTAAFYFRIPFDVALKRILNNRQELKYYEAGMDLGLSSDIKESFKIFQEKILKEYERIADEYKLTIIDATLPINKQQKRVREIILRNIKGLKKFPRSHRHYEHLIEKSELLL